MVVVESVTNRDHGEGTVYNPCSNGGIDWRLHSCRLEDTGGIVEDLFWRDRKVLAYTAPIVEWSLFFAHIFFLESAFSVCTHRQMHLQHWPQTAAGRAAAWLRSWWADDIVVTGTVPGWIPSSPCPFSSSPPSSLPTCLLPPACLSASAGLMSRWLERICECTMVLYMCISLLLNLYGSTVFALISLSHMLTNSDLYLWLVEPICATG